MLALTIDCAGVHASEPVKSMQFAPKKIEQYLLSSPHAIPMCRIQVYLV